MTTMQIGIEPVFSKSELVVGVRPGEARTMGSSQEEMENAEKLITKILGQHCIRREWTELDLRAKDKLKQAPCRTREQSGRRERDQGQAQG
jgi:hypothetical protein